MPIEETSNSLLERLQKLSPKRLALLAAELERRLAARDEAAAEPIAVIGMACRMPGGAETADEFWEILAEGRDAIELVPADRWDVEAFYDPRPDMPGKTATKWGGFVRQIDQFDPGFFGISPREALGMDPQQRMLLEVAWEALESAGERSSSLMESATGVYVGISTSDYASLVNLSGDAAFDAYSGTGLAHSTAAGRISYFLGLKGPNLALDTSCSSSAVAIHLACQGLRQRDCRRALAGGVNAILSPQITIMLSQAHMLASDGRCKAFSQSADGFVRSEGCGILVLKRLADAQADGDRILGVIRGSAVNHDGRSSGLAAPNGPSQEAVVKAALAQAGLSPRDIDYVETHGTGTVLGDAIELGALKDVFGKDRDAGSRLLLGAVKTNVGHLEAAAGVAGVIKVLLGLNHECIPANLHLQMDNENEALQAQLFEVPRTAMEWQRTNRPRIAGVSSFGFSGTNAHVIIEEAPLAEPAIAGPPIEVEIVTVSAKTPAALSALCGRYAQFLREHPRTVLGDFAYTANACRSQFQHRAAFLARTVEDAAAQFAQLSVANLEESPTYHFVAGYQAPPIAFLFTGQGSQYTAMGRAFYAGNAVFRAAIDRCDRVLSGKLAYRLSAVLACAPDVPRDLIDDTAWTQPALFAFEYALATMWQSWGVRPSAVLGHSLGEYVAACVAGVFSFEEALTLAYERGRLMGGLPRNGGMLAVRASEAAVFQAVGQLSAAVSIAAVNGPESIVLSGQSEEIRDLNRLLTEKGIKAQPLTVSHAFHSPMMDAMLDEFEQRASELKYSAPEIPFISNVTGGLFVPGERIDARYWRRHVRGTVRFSGGLDALLELQPAALVEIGPHPVLLGMAKFAYPDLALPSVPALRRGRDEWQCAFEALQQLYLLGAQIDWDAVYRDRAKQKLALPTYPFQRQRYWIAVKPPPQQDAKAGLESVPASDKFDPLLYEVEWSSIAGGIGGARERALDQKPEQVMEAAEETVNWFVADPEFRRNIEAYGRFKPELDRLSVGYILQALGKLGVDVRKGTRLPQRDLSTALGVLPQHRRLIDRLFAILEEDGLIQRAEGVWEFTAIARPVDAKMERDRLLAEYPQFAGELGFVGQASHLGDVLRGRMGAMEALFPQGSFAVAESLYQDTQSALMFNRAVGAVIQRTVEMYSVDHKIKILEIGGGTGSTTSQVLPRLDADRVEYIFTDVSPAFLGAAEKKFAAFPFMKYGTVDAETAGDTKWIDPHSIDIILAANVVHATADLRNTLEHFKCLLRPGGTMVLLEATVPQRFGDVTGGMTDGWWRYADAPLREHYPLIGRHQWLELLSSVGFSAAALGEDGLASILTSQQTIIVAQSREAMAVQKSHRTLLLGQGVRLKQAQEAFAAAGIAVLLGESPEKGLHLAGQEFQDLSNQDLSRERSRIRSWLQEADSPQSVVLLLPDRSKAKDIPQAALENAAAVLALLQEAIDTGRAAPDIWLVTNGAYAYEMSGRLDLPASVIGAVLKVARSEHPDLCVRQVDLPREPAEEDLAQLAALVQQGTEEHTIVLRRGRMAVPRLISLNQTARTRGRALEIRPQAAYLVAGAFGGLGFRTVQWLADRGATEIYLVGHNEPSAQRKEQIEKLRAFGTRIHTIVADISERQAMERVFGLVASASSQLRGIVNAAMSLDDALLMRQTPEKFAGAFAPKVRGGWLLHELSSQYPLDFFVMFGSAASVLGPAGLANYAAANAFLDSLAEARRQQGLAATTIAWGPWSEIGMATRLKKTGREDMLGLSAMSPGKALELLEQAIESGAPAVATLPIDWTMYLAPQQPHHGWPLYQKLSVPIVVKTDGTASVTLASLLERTPDEDRLNVIKHYLSVSIASVLRLEPGVILREDQPLSELGLDSLMALELKNELQNAAGAALPSTFLFEYPTLHLAATYLDALMVGTRGSELAEADSSGYEEIVL